jgi:hypothetical protein
MGNSDYILTGGKIFYSTGNAMEMDLWLRDGKIYYIHSRIRNKPDAMILDASQYGVFPGRIYEKPLWHLTRNRARYIERMKELVRMGYTSFIEMIQWKPNVRLGRLIRYEQSLHANSPLDHSYSLFLPIKQLRHEMLKVLHSHHIRQLVVRASSPAHFKGVNWSRIGTSLKQYGMRISLYPQSTGIGTDFSRKTIEELLQYWYYLSDCYEFSADVINPDFFRDHQGNTTIDNIQQFILKSSAIPAKRAGIFPHKGSIAIGSDADLVLVSLQELEKERRYTPQIVFLKGKPILLPDPKLPYGQGNQLKTHSAFAYVYSD